MKNKNIKEYFRYILLFYYRNGKNAVQARKKLCEMYREDVLAIAKTSLQNFVLAFTILKMHHVLEDQLKLMKKKEKVILSVWWDFKGIVFFLSFYQIIPQLKNCPYLFS